jgi:hypothetical protein
MAQNSFRLPTLPNLQRRRSELLAQLAMHPRPEEQPDQEHEENQTPPAPSHPSKPVAGPILSRAACHGLAGLAVNTIAPHTEADPAAVLLQFLAAFGNIIGPGPHCMVESTRHSLNLFVILVGESSKARKGTSWRQIARLFSELDDPWITSRVTTGRLSPDGLIHTLRDQEPPTDRRLLVLCEEFAGVLHALGRQNGHLSPLLRGAWDTGNLRTLDRRDPLQATGTHISLIGHITQYELSRRLQPTDAHNGFANRCLWTCARRSQLLPEGGSLASEDLSPIARELRRALHWVGSATAQTWRRDAAARDLWREHYSGLSQARAGLYGAATTRAEAQVLRLSALYAILDCSPVIAVPHLEAALAVWDYCFASAACVFGTATGDPTADRIHRALNASPDGLSREQIRKLFHGHVSSDCIDDALEQLSGMGTVISRTSQGSGRPVTLWAAIEAENPPPQ